MLRHIESELPSTMHLPISSYYTLHFYMYLSAHVLIADGQFLLLIDVPIHNRAQQLQIYGVFSLPVPHSNLSAQYKINYGNTWESHMMREGQLPAQISSTEPVSMQICRINAPFQLLTNPAIIITAIYAKMTKQ